MLHARTVITNPHFVIRAVDCTDDHTRWSPAEAPPGPQIVLVRRGHFRLDSRGRRFTADPTTGYLHRPAEELRFSHPAGGDTCTSITFIDHALTEGIASAPSPSIRVDPHLELAHRILLRTTADPDFATTEAVIHLLTLALRDQPATTPAPGRADLAAQAREAILANTPASATLVTLARHLNTSPAHLSRTFHHHIGLPISRYRTRVRISQALTRLDQGESHLATLAADLGFSDQSHLTRVLHRELGHPPARIRALLSETPPTGN
ncbi:helix-turn-helix domain-containing protein [Nocardia sp. NPDC127526]|uniref:helix-turn-helix domain-containing protein n=1 Tax=Nocardia sp. NPDC127526 TaxID=3345393 RepID=UPI00363AFE66